MRVRQCQQIDEGRQIIKRHKKPVITLNSQTNNWVGALKLSWKITEEMHTDKAKYWSEIMTKYTIVTRIIRS